MVKLETENGTVTQGPTFETNLNFHQEIHCMYKILFGGTTLSDQPFPSFTVIQFRRL